VVLYLTPHRVNSRAIVAASVTAISAVTAISRVTSVFIAPTITAVINRGWSRIVSVTKGIGSGKITLLSSFFVLKNSIS